MLHKIMSELFLNLKLSSKFQPKKKLPIRSDDIIAEAYVYVEPIQIYEGDDLQIFIKIKNIMVEFKFFNKTKLKF